MPSLVTKATLLPLPSLPGTVACRILIVSSYLLLKFTLAKVWIFLQFPSLKQKKNREYLFNPCYLCSQNAPIPSLHSLSFQPFRKHCSLTIFNSFNFIAHEFSAGGNLLEIFRVFEGLAKDCISTPCKHIENRPEKDGVLMVRKRRLFSRKRRVSSAKTKSFESKDFVFLRKNAVFFIRGNLLIILKVPFYTKITSKHEKIPSKFSFHTLVSLLRK